MISTQNFLIDHLDKREMQGALFAELSEMFSREVPLYTHSLSVNRLSNRVVSDLLGVRFSGFSVSDDEIEYASGERHGAIRIGRPDEYRWVARFFACFDMHPHNFYDMTSIGAKSQPVIATAFRSTFNPDHRVFSSLLMTDAFDLETRNEIEELLSKRSIVSERAKELIERSESQGGLGADDARELILEATSRIFKWQGTASNPDLYHRLCAQGYKIAADIACFHSHHLNHLTPNTLCMDLYTACMRFVLDEIDESVFTRSANEAIAMMLKWMDVDSLRLHFKHLDESRFGFETMNAVDDDVIVTSVSSLKQGIESVREQVRHLEHNGFKDRTEGPPAGKLILLRQDAYRALREPIEFTDDESDVQVIHHTARFGEIEQRYYATTPAGRALYDACLDAYESTSDAVCEGYAPVNSSLQMKAFDGIPGALRELAAKGLVYVRYIPISSEGGRAIQDVSPENLMELGLIRVEGLRYEDFLPASAAGIFASNLDQYGINARMHNDSRALQEYLEETLGRAVIDSDRVYAAIQAGSLLDCYEQLGLMDMVEVDELAKLRATRKMLPIDDQAGRL